MDIILIQGAEKEETDFLEDILENKEEIIIGEYNFLKGKYGVQDVVISRTKVGEINASAATAIGILKFNPKYIINQGTAGGHGKDIHKGDIVVGKSYFQLNSYYSNYIEEGKGFSLDNWIIREYGITSNENVKKYRFADENLLKLAEDILPKISETKVFFGVIGSGDVWNRESDRILYLNEKYETLCEEMETAGVYKTANNLHVPVIGIRIISNNEVLREEYEPEIANRCQKIVYEFVKRIEEV